jgi:hypothetical protein
VKGNNRTLFGQSLLSEATSGDLVVEAYPGSTLTDNAVSIAHFDYLNKQNFLLLLCRSQIFAVLSASIGQVQLRDSSAVSGSGLSIRSNETSALNMIQILEGVSRRAISLLTCVRSHVASENWRDYCAGGENYSSAQLSLWGLWY